MFHSSSLSEGQLVAICQYERKDGVALMSAPLAIGRMAVPSDQLAEGKGKATLIVHTWKDHLWDSGSKREAPVPTPIGAQNQVPVTDSDDEDASPVDENVTTPPAEETETDVPAAVESTSVAAYSKEEVSTLLRLSLLQAISTTLATLPASAFPIPLSTFYSTYVLPSRPAFPSLLLPSPIAEPNPQDITMKGSSHKSLTAFIKAAEKEVLLATKAPQKHTQQPELVITSVNGRHPSVQGHNSFVTIGDIEAKAAKKAQREEQEREKQAQAQGELEVRELWKPHQSTVELFQAMNARYIRPSPQFTLINLMHRSTSDFYTIPEIRTLVNAYIVSKDIINPHDKAYINLDPALRKCVLSKAPTAKKLKDGEPAEPDAEFIKRDELHRKVIERMQTWHEVRGEGKEAVVKKGQLFPIQVVVKVRQGRKASTLITGFEPFFVIAEDMADELRKSCAGATSGKLHHLL